MSHRKYIQFLLYFNSQPHEEADGESFVTDICVGSISTHSLTRRLTTSTSYAFIIDTISTHSLTRRLTVSCFANAPPMSFQLTASRGGWLPFLILVTFPLYFNSQPHEEADNLRESRQKCLLHFNSQPHEEADLMRQHQGGFLYYFNSQPHEEADNQRRLECGYFSISTHSLTRRLTMKMVYWFRLSVISTHSLTRRLTGILVSRPVKEVFQLTASRGGWLVRL